MNIKIDKPEALHAYFNVTIDYADYKDSFEKGLKELSKKAFIPGFRPGHTPIGLLKKKFGYEVLADELNKMVNKELDNYLKENNLKLLGDPLPADTERQTINYDEQNSYSFTYELGIQPEIDLTKNLNKEKTFTKYRIPAKEEEINEEIERLKKRYGKREEVDEAADGDIIYIHLHELNSDGTEKENGTDAHAYFTFSMLTEKGKEIFNEVKKNLTQNIDDVFSVFTAEKINIAKNILHLENATEETLKTINAAFTCRVEKIVRILPADLNEDFFKQIEKELGQIKDEDALRAKIKEVIEGYNDRITESTLENDIFKFLTDTTDVPLPEVFLRKWFRGTLEGELSDEDFEKQYAEFISRLKQSLIYRKMQSEHKVEVKKEDIIDEALHTTRNSYGQWGEDFVTYMAKNSLKDKTFIENMHDRVLQKKFFDVLKGYVTIQDAETTLEEFQNMNKEEVYANQ